MKTDELNIALIGYGRMGQALFQGWQQAGISANYTVVSPGESNIQNANSYDNIAEATDNLRQANLICLAVKPQIMDQICSELKPVLNKDCLILSIAAGRTLKSFESHFGIKQPIVRTMPNTPAAIGKGIAVSIANEAVLLNQKQIADMLITTSGGSLWLEDESFMDAVTAISGSGPAYVFYFIEALTNAALKAGLPEDVANTLARQTVIGSAHLAEQEIDSSAALLRENVTSPGGTTEAALKVLMAGEFSQILDKAVQEAISRGQDLAKI